MENSLTTQSLMLAAVFMVASLPTQSQELGLWGCSKADEGCQLPGSLVMKHALFASPRIDMWALYTTLSAFQEVPDIARGPASFNGGKERAERVIVKRGAKHLFSGDGAQAALEVEVIEWGENGHYLVDVTAFAVGDEPFHLKHRFQGVKQGWKLLKVVQIENK